MIELKKEKSKNNSVMRVTMAFYKKHLGSLPVTYWGLCCSYFYFEKFAHKYKQHKQDMSTTWGKDEPNIVFMMKS